jgi:uncharacterized protein
MTRQDEIIEDTIRFVKQTLKNAEGGHDWWHIYRVLNLCKLISKTENVDPFIVQLGALLHDISDAKFHNGNENLGPELAKEYLVSQGIDEYTINKVLHIIRNVSFKNRDNAIGPPDPELAVIMDADRLDAMGAIGIARAFNYGGFKNRLMYDPAIAPHPDQSALEYKNSNSPTINHFYEKLLLLKDMMNTATGKQLAIERHEYMLGFLARFLDEWDPMAQKKPE